MPELPEVENIRRKLASVEGKTIVSIWVGEKKLKKINKKDLEKIKNERIISVKRRNKYLVFEGNNFWLLSHLGMSGQYYWLNNKDTEPKHTHIKIHFNNGNILAYRDPRRFGVFYAYKKTENKDYLKLPELEGLGVEPNDKIFTAEKLNSLLKEKKQNIKSFLMDQAQVCGIGNIYASEILFTSGLSPTREAGKLTKSEKIILYKQIKKIINQAIRMGGSSISDFINVDGNKGDMQNHHLVYGRNGQKCKKCNNSIFKIKQGGRSTFYCKKCQK